MNRYIAIFLFLLCTLLFFANSQFGKVLAQNQSNNKNIELIDLARPAMTVFKDSDGLPQNTISKLTIDSKGYLWVIAGDEIAYFNGHKWTSINPPDKTEIKLLASLGFMTATSDGGVWFGIPTFGLFQIKDGKWTKFDKEPNFLNKESSCLIETKSSEGKSIIWVGTRQGLLKLEDEKWTLIDTNSISTKTIIYDLIETRSLEGKSIIWAATNKGLAKVEDGKRIVIDTNSIFSSIFINDLIETKSSEGNSIIWIATDNGLVSFEEGKWTKFDTSNGLPSNSISSLLKTRSVDGSFIIWAGTEKGLVKLEKGEWSFLGNKFDEKNALNSSIKNLVETTTPDGNSVIWVGTENGLIRLQTGLVKTLNTKPVLAYNPSNLMETISSNGNSTIWVGGQKTLAKFENGKWTKIETTSGLSNSTVFSLLETKDINGVSIIWAGTTEGLAKFENDKWSIVDIKILSNKFIYSLLETKTVNGDSIIWVGSFEGLTKFEGGEWTVFKNKTISSAAVLSLLESKNAKGDSIVWVGTTEGLAKFEGGKWTIFNTLSGLPSNVISSLYESKTNGNHTLWVGTDNGIGKLNLDNPSNKWENFSVTTKIALPNNTIHQIYEDNQHRIYIFTNKGLTRLTKRSPTPEDVSEYSVYTFTTKDGLLSNQFLSGHGYMKDSKGRIWGSSLEGIVIFDPSQEIQKPSLKPLYIESATLTESKKNITENELLNYNQNNIEFEYALLSLVGEHKTLYKTQLLGLEEKASEWLPDYKKPYNNLGQGTYTFKVWGKDYLGNITEPVSINFKIRPAPWYTWWAYSGYFMILVVSTYLVYKRNLKVLEKRNKLLESKVIERTNELDNKNKLLAENVDQLEIAKQEVDNKNVELDKKNEELAEKLDLLDKKNEELINSHKELEESYKQAEKIFSALAEALPGTVLDDKYRLENKIGSGGFGAVYRATHLVLNHFVAVKVFSPTANNATTESLDRFRLEGISACRVNHPNAISVLDFGVSSEGIAYLVMELLNGYTLEDEIKKEGKLSLERVSKIIIPVCDVLFKAHENSIIHRDIKASNIFLHNSGAGEVVKVLDFGIAKLTGDSKEFEKLTITGNILGTPVYMAPERLSSKPYDGKSDVYSLGILLYEMLCGHPPFSSSNFDLMALILAHVKETPKPLRNFDPSIPEDVENLVLKTLSKDPNLRPTAKELAEDFAKILGIECNLISTSVLQRTYEEKNTRSKSTATQELETLKFEPDTQK